jgi:hypothetical protein
MGRRSENLFRRNDVMRAIRSATDAGVPVAGVEITCKDGTVIKVLGENAAQAQDNTDAAWMARFAELEANKKAKPKAKAAKRS